MLIVGKDTPVLTAALAPLLSTDSWKLPVKAKLETLARRVVTAFLAAMLCKFEFLTQL